MGNITKIIMTVGTVLVIVTVAIVWFTGRSTPTADTSADNLFASLEFNTKAREECSKVFAETAKMDLGGTQFDQVSDGSKQATFTYRGDTTTPFKKVVCKFEKGKGVIGLSVDEKTLVSSQ